VVVAGSSAIDRTDRFTQEYLVQRIVGHKDYNGSTLENDIALLFLNGFIPWESPGVRAIPLAIKAPEEGTTCLIHGWGKVTMVSDWEHSNHVIVRSTFNSEGEIGFAAASASTDPQQGALPGDLQAARLPDVRRIFAGRHRCLPG